MFSQICFRYVDNEFTKLLRIISHFFDDCMTTRSFNVLDHVVDAAHWITTHSFFTQLMPKFSEYQPFVLSWTDFDPMDSHDKRG
jgi:hypothetical protein